MKGARGRTASIARTAPPPLSPPPRLWPSRQSADRGRGLDAAVGLVVLVAGAVDLGAACAPWSVAGEACLDAPCAPGLVCTDGICVEPPPPPPPPCATDDECALDGDASGRVCDAGICRFASCAIDAQCGTRICVQGSCAPAVVCSVHVDCGSYPLEICDDGTCRPACFDDSACGPSLGGLGLQTCVEGRCLARCLNDATCLGQGICEAGACQAPECTGDDDCGEGDVFCDGGRCTAFAPCAADNDCFDPNFFCDIDDTPVRCAERPTCRADAECGADALCLDAHCRPTTGCFVDEDCGDADDECVAGRCVRRPACRGDDDCETGRVCAGLACVAAPETVAVVSVVVADDLGACVAARPCRRVLFAGEALSFRWQGFDAAGLAVVGAVAVGAEGAVAAAATGDAIAVSTIGPGSGRVTVGDVVIEVVVVEPVVPLAVLVQRKEGGPADGVAVTVGDRVVATAADGLALFDPAPAGADTILAVAASPARGVLLVDDIGARIATGGRVRLVIDDAPVPTTAAPLLATVQTTGDELGPVGIGAVLPALPGPERADVVALFGDVARGQVTLPVVGAIPIALPASLSLSASLPLVGEQQVRPLAELSPVAGPSFAFALEDRREQQDLVQIALAADPYEFVLDLAEQSEGLDAAIVPLGIVEERPLVADIDDRDGDGDTAERVADFAAAPTVNTVPSVPPRERTGVKCRPPADGADRALVVVGLDLPGRFVVTGTGVVRGATGFEDVPLAEGMKSVPPPANLTRTRRALAVHAFFADQAFASRAVVRADKLAAEVDLGALLDPPSGAFVLADLPTPGDRSVILPADPAVTHVRVTLDVVIDGAAVVLDAWSATTGALRLPAAAQDPVVRAVDVFVLDTDPFAAGLGAVDVDHVARKAARAPGG
jgi:hypothetical protein